jgi:hypothetical protein
MNIVAKWLVLCFVFGRSWVKNLDLETRYLEVFCGFLQSLQGSAGMVP